MTRITAFALILWSFFLFTRCKSEGGRQQEISERIKEFTTINENTYLSRGERKKKTDTLAHQLTRLYPSALPIGKDSTSRIFRAKQPDTVGMFQRTDQYTTYDKATPERDVPFTYPKEKYFSGLINYGLRRGKHWVPRQGMIVMVMDLGYVPEWFGLALQERILTGKFQGSLGSMMQSHEFMQTIEYAGQTWAVWYDPYRRQRNHVGSRVFITHWNHRFSVAAITTDTSMYQPDFVGKLVDFNWLSQLKYPIK